MSKKNLPSHRVTDKVAAPQGCRDLVDLAVETATRLRESGGLPLKVIRVSLEGVGSVEVELMMFPEQTSGIQAAIAPLTDMNARVEKARELIKVGNVFQKGCSEFVCEVLGVPSWESAKALMGTPTVKVGYPPNYDYSVIEPGDIVGFLKENGSKNDHVAIYLGGKRFADVPGEGEAPRELGRWTNQDCVMKSSRFS